MLAWARYSARREVLPYTIAVILLGALGPAGPKDFVRVINPSTRRSSALAYAIV